MTLPESGAIARAAVAVLAFPWRVMRWCAGSLWRLLALTIVTFSLFSGGSVAAYGYWSSPGFCNSCHIMEPYWDSWAKSSHHEVRCVDCHFEPGLENELHGKWVAVKQLAAAVTGAYSSMPYAEVADVSCMRSGCHTAAELSKPVEFSGRGIRFDHTSHSGELQRGIVLACTSCHNQHTRDVHMEVDRSTCFLCHFHESGSAVQEMGACETCHGPPSGTLQVAGEAFNHEQVAARGMRCTQCHAELVVGNGQVGRDRCLSCHNRTDQLERLGDVGLLHIEHVTKRKLHCYQCHGMIEHQKVEHRVALPAAESDCARCHAGQEHSEPGRLYAGVGAKLASAKPDAMHRLGVDCTGCHAAAVHGEMHGEVHGAAMCRSCHQDVYDRFVPAVAENFGALQRHLDGRLAALFAAMEARRVAGEVIKRPVYQAAVRARDDLALVELGKAIHNPLYAIDVLRAVELAVADAEDALGLEQPEELPLGFAVEDCDTCHAALPMPGDLVLSDGRAYPHPPHANETGLGCADCHIGDAHPGVAPTQPASCKQCHKDKE